MQEEHRINPNTHTQINAKYLPKLFFGQFCTNFIADIFDTLLVIVYFRTLNLTDNYDQILIQKSIIALLFMFCVSLLIRCAKIINACRYYGQNLRKDEIDKKITFENNTLFSVLSFILSIIFQVPAIPLMYYFVPFTKTKMCDMYGPINCNLMKAYCAYELIVMSVLGMICICGFFGLPTYFTGTAKNIAVFLRDNVLGLLYGNMINRFNEATLIN